MLFQQSDLSLLLSSRPHSRESLASCPSCQNDKEIILTSGEHPAAVIDSVRLLKKIFGLSSQMFLLGGPLFEHRSRPANQRGPEGWNPKEVEFD